jgi:flavin-dependent dehydrogenase
MIDDKIFVNHGIYNARINSKSTKINLKNLFQQELRSKNINISPNNWQSHPIPWNEKISEISKPNILLAGDSAGIEPFIGGGIHLSLAYGKLASDTIIKAFNENDFSFDNYTKNYQNYTFGKYIKKLTQIAKEAYSGNINIIDTLNKLLNTQV